MERFEIPIKYNNPILTLTKHRIIGVGHLPAYSLDLDTHNWLDTNVRVWNIEFPRDPFKYTDYCIFVFTLKKDALRFKLKWA